MSRSYDVIPFISKIFILRRSRAAIFTDIIKIVIMFVKVILKDSKKVMIIRNYI